jgi:hypothetical protein
MEKMNIYRVIGLKRDLEMNDFVSLLYPSDENFAPAKVKCFTENIYVREIGCYVIGVFDLVKSKPGLLILNHTLFSALKRWKADSLQDIIGKTFDIESKTNNFGVVYHDIYCVGLLPLCTKEIMEEMDNYLNNLFEMTGDDE